MFDHAVMGSLAPLHAHSTYLGVYLGSLLLALLITPLTIRLARRIGAVDWPGVRSVHKRPVPRVGGVAIFLSAITAMIAVLFLDNRIGEQCRMSWIKLGTLLCAAAFVFLIGLVDDLRHLPARCKFLVELVMAGALCAAGVRISTISLGGGWNLPLGSMGCLLTLLWVVGITNAVNLSDGLDGLAAGISAVTCGVIAIFAIHRGQVIMAAMMLALLGSLSGFLVFNFNPAKVFMGDCGSLFLGFMIAGASVMCLAQTPALVGLALPSLALGIPIFDTFFSMLRRFLERRSLFAPDRSHFHHRLLDLGLQQRHAVIVIYLATLMSAGLGLFMMVAQDVGALVVFGGLLLLIMLLFRVVGAIRLRETIERLQMKYAYSRRERQERQVFEQLQLQLRQVRQESEWWEMLCEAGRRLELAWLSVRRVDSDGNVNTSIWRRDHAPSRSDRVVTMNVPVGDCVRGKSVELEIAVLIKGSLESANHRAGLFTRLIDEGIGHRPAILSPAALGHKDVPSFVMRDTTHMHHS